MLLLFHRMVSGAVFFQRDVQLLWLSHVETFVRAVWERAWPVWNPSLAFGQPLWADANAQIAYPPTWLNMILRPWRYYTLYAIGHFVLGAAGIYGLARRLELTREAALAAAAMWIAAGPTVSTAPMWNQLAGAAWLPWSMLAAEAALDSGRTTHALAWGATLAAPILAGSPEGALMGALIGGALALGRIRRGSVSHAAFSLAVAGAFALTLSAAQWLPSVEAARRSARTSLGPEARAYWSVPPIALLQTLLPVLVDAAGLRPERAAELSGSREPFFASLYLGLAGAGLVLAAWAGPPRRRRVFFTAALLAGAAVALGRHTPLYGWAEVVVPPLRALRYPAKAMALAAFAWSLLAGMGVDAWRGLVGWPRSTRARVLLPLAGLTVAAGAAAVLLFRDADRWGAWAFAPPAPGLSVADLLAPTRGRLVVAALAAAAVLAIGIRGGRFPLRRPEAAVALCAVADLVFAHRSINPGAPPALYTHRPELIDLVRPGSGQRVYVYDYFFAGRSHRHLGRAAPYVVARAPAGWPIRAAQALAMRLYLFPPSGAPWGIEGSYDLDVPALGSAYVAALGERLRASEGTPAHLRLLQVGAVGHVVALHDAGFEALERVALVDSLFPEPIRVFRVPAPRPRTYAVGGARVADGPDALSLLTDPAFDPAREIVLADGSAATGPPGFSGTSRVVSRTADRMEVEAELGGDGYVVLVDAWDPAWRATMDGRPAEARRANVGFIAVAAPAGRHRIELRYRPAALPWGLAITALALVAGAAAIYETARRAGSDP